jgi:hypothetical protein
MNLYPFFSLLSAIFLAFTLTSVALPSFAVSKEQIAHEAQRRAATLFLDQIRSSMNELSGEPIETAVARLGYPTEEKHLLGKTYVIWQSIGPEVETGNFTTFTRGWTSTQTVSSAVSYINFSSYSFGGFTFGSGSGRASGSSSSSSSGQSISRGSSKKVKRKIQCTITLAVDDQRRATGWQIGRDSSLEHCAPMLNVRVSGELLEQEMEKLQKQAALYEEGKVVWIEGGQSCGSHPRTTPINKVAILPFGSDDSSCLGITRPTDEKVASVLITSIQNNPSLNLVYSYYDKTDGQPVQTNAEELWDSSGTPSARAYAFGKKHDADAVIMSWRWSDGYGDCTGRSGDRTIETYLLDVESQCRYSVKGDEGDSDELNKRLFTRFVSGPVTQAQAMTQKK